MSKLEELRSKFKLNRETVPNDSLEKEYIKNILNKFNLNLDIEKVQALCKTKAELFDYIDNTIEQINSSCKECSGAGCKSCLE